jgi:hypothetical protein
MVIWYIFYGNLVNFIFVLASPEPPCCCKKPASIYSQFFSSVFFSKLLPFCCQSSPLKTHGVFVDHNLWPIYTQITHPSSCPDFLLLARRKYRPTQTRTATQIPKIRILCTFKTPRINGGRFLTTRFAPGLNDKYLGRKFCAHWKNWISGYRKTTWVQNNYLGIEQLPGYSTTMYLGTDLGTEQLSGYRITTWEQNNYQDTEQLNGYITTTWV